MKILLKLILFLLLGVNCFSQEQYSNANKEPKAIFVVQVNDTEYTVLEGEELKLDSTIKQPVISIELADFKNFDNGSISFNYPSNFSFEFEEDYGYRNWALDGNDFVIMYFEIDVQTELDDIVKEMVKQFGKKNCKTERIQLSVGGKTLTGKRINISIVGQKMTLDFLEIELNDLKSRFIAFQDTKNEDGSSSEESKSTIIMIDDSIEYE